MLILLREIISVYRKKRTVQEDDQVIKQWSAGIGGVYRIQQRW